MSAFDPQRQFASVNYRIEERSLALLGHCMLVVVDAPGQLLSLAGQESTAEPFISGH
jgi:hypothetical protein